MPIRGGAFGIFGDNKDFYSCSHDKKCDEDRRLLSAHSSFHSLSRIAEQWDQFVDVGSRGFD